MTTPTMIKFGHPDTVIHEEGDWVVLARPQQVTLGSLVLASRQPVLRFGAVSDSGFAAMGPVVRRIEKALSDFVSYDRINYLMLMMIDPDVHFHVIPRYEGERRFAGLVFPDVGWPGPPDLAAFVEPGAEQRAELVTALRRAWRDAAE